MSEPQILLVGAGMIAHDQILPSLYQLQRNHVIGELTVTSQNGRSIAALANAPGIRRAFPNHGFKRYPLDDDGPQPDAFRHAIAQLPPHQIVIAAVPDQLHYDVVMTALRHDQHVICVKPLVLTTTESHEIEREARARGLAVGVEYHKRPTTAASWPAAAIKKGCSVSSNSAPPASWRNGITAIPTSRTGAPPNTPTPSPTSAATTSISSTLSLACCPPPSASMASRADTPNGNEGYLWTDARVLWSNGACLNVQNTLSFPDAAPGTNTQGITMYFSDGKTGAWLQHDDQYRGLRYAYVRNPGGDGATQFAEPSPDYMQYVKLGSPGLVPVGYGFRSIEFIIRQILRVHGSLEDRQRTLAAIDEAGVMATPANSRYNELVTEAGRLSILNNGREVAIEYGDQPHVHFKH